MTSYHYKNILPQSFYARDALIVASDLVGKIIRHDLVALRITETEAYCWPNDSANHAYKGKTMRNLAMWGPPGHTYVYLCYGLHNMLNFVSNKDGEAAAVLIRSCEPVDGVELIKQRRGGLLDQTKWLTGPGKIAQALAINRTFSHHPLFIKGGLEVFDAPAATRIVRGPRVGIDYAELKDRNAPWRFADGNSCFVSHKKSLQ